LALLALAVDELEHIYIAIVLAEETTPTKMLHFLS
jgi:hypothetical protein